MVPLLPSYENASGHEQVMNFKIKGEGKKLRPVDFAFACPVYVFKRIPSYLNVPMADVPCLRGSAFVSLNKISDLPLELGHRLQACKVGSRPVFLGELCRR